MVTKISDFLNTTFSTLTLNDAVNNSVVYPGTIVHTTTGTPGAGIGAGLIYQVETSNNNNEYGMTLETVTTDVTAGSEDFDFIVKLMQNGAAAGERLRLNSAGQLTVSAGLVATSLLTSNGGMAETSGVNNGLRLVNPGGGSYVAAPSSVTGAIKIKLPTSAYSSSTMLQMTVKIYEYAGSASGVSRAINLGGYNYVDNNWYNFFATQQTMGGGDINVRFGHDGTSNCIWIGDTSTVWSYPQIFVTDFQAGHSNFTPTQWRSGWTISIVTVLDTVTAGPIVCAKNLTTTGGWSVNGTIQTNGAATVNSLVSNGAVSGTTGAFSGALTLTSAAPQITLNNGTSNWISWNTNGVAAPTFTTRSVGTKLVLYPSVAAAAADYAIGIEGSTLWQSVDTTSAQFKWYGGVTQAMLLSGAGALSTTSTTTSTAFIPSGASVPTNGMYLPAANTVGFGTNSGEKMRISPTGNVGINNTSPLYRLHVNNVATVGTSASILSNAQPILYLDNGAGIGGSIVIKTHSPGNGNQIGAIKFAASPDASNYSWAGMAGIADTNSAASALAFYTATGNGQATAAGASTERMRIDINGYVGIGTTTPATLLHVRGGAGGINSVFDSNSSADTRFELRNNATRAGYIYWDANEVRYFADTSRIATFYTNATEKMRIDPTGNVGINVLSPVVALHVEGSGGIFSRSGYNFATVSGVGSAGDAIFGGGIISDVAVNQVRKTVTDPGHFIAIQTTEGIKFHTGLAGAVGATFARTANERMRIDSFGNVSIGTTTVFYNSANRTSLSINGTSQAILGLGTGGSTRGYVYHDGSSMYVNADTGSLYAGPTGANSLFMQTNNIVRMTVTPTGNVMIGTTTVTPAGLAVVSNLNNSAIALASLDASTVTIRNDSVAGLNITSKLNFNVATIGASVVAGYYAAFNASNDIGTGLLFGTQTNAAGGTVERMRIDANGNVSIGNSSSLTKLSVTGETSLGQGNKLTFIGLDLASGGTPTYIKIRTRIPITSASADFTVNIKGFAYSYASVCDLKISWHYYLSTFYNPTISSSGGWAPTVKLSGENGVVCIVLYTPSYWPKLYVESMYSSNYNDDYASGWTWVDEDATGTPLVTLSYKSDFGNRFVMATDGYVGIGTTIPRELLHLNNPSAAGDTPRIKFTNTNTGGGVSDGGFVGISNQNQMDLWNNEASLVRIGTSGTERMRVDASGNVSIGTNLVGAASGGRISLTVNGTNGSLLALATGDTLRGYVFTDTANMSATCMGGTMTVQTAVAQPVIFATNSIERMRVTSGGNLLIGTTTTPLNGNATVVVQGIGTNGPGLQLSTGSGGMLLDGLVGGGVTFKTHSGAVGSEAYTERMRIDSVGNVGIGTSTVQTGYKLQVEGDFAATTKSFVINHPTKPGKMLRYGSLESPYHGVRLTGEAEVVDGKCTVDLPDYISGLCHQKGSQVQITNIRHGKTLWIHDIDIENNRFTIKTRGKGKYRFYWSFTAVRKDIEDMLVEFNKE